MEIKELFEALDQKLDLVDFKQIHRNFSPLEYGIYIDGNLYTHEDQEPFFNSYNNPDLYRNLVIVSYEEDLDIMASYLVSKMFKRFLFTNYNKMVPNSLMLLNYPDNFMAMGYANYEYKTLIKAYKNKDVNIKMALFRLVINMRSLRSELIDSKYFKEESKLETLNGFLADSFFYALKCCNNSKASRIEAFFLSNYGLLKKDNMNIEFSTLSRGFLYKRILNSLGYKDFDYNVSLFDFCLLNISFVNENIKLKTPKSLLDCSKEYRQEITELFSAYFATDPKKVSLDARIHSYSPNKMYRLDDNIYCSDFVVLEKNIDKEFVFLQGPVVIKTKENSFDEVNAYYYLNL